MALDKHAAAAWIVTAVRDWSLGYGQGSGPGGRWDHRNGGAADCSSLVAAALNHGGITPPLAYDTYTGNLRTRLTARGWQSLPTSTTPQLGDVLLWEGHHTAMCIGPDTLAEAWINELGTTIGGQPGDQTGQETRLIAASQHPDRTRWTHLLRPPAPFKEISLAVKTPQQDGTEMLTRDDITAGVRDALTSVLQASQNKIGDTGRYEIVPVWRDDTKDDAKRDFYLIDLTAWTSRHIGRGDLLTLLQNRGVHTASTREKAFLDTFTTKEN